MVWQGDFENQQRASKRLMEVVPISLLLIFLLLFIMFGNLKDAGLVFLNVPFAVVGGVFALAHHRYQFQYFCRYRIYCIIRDLHFGRCIADNCI